MTDLVKAVVLDQQAMGAVLMIIHRSGVETIKAIDEKLLPMPVSVILRRLAVAAERGQLGPGFKSGGPMRVIDDPLLKMGIFAWVGEDELGSGQLGIKQGLVPAGCIPLVSVDQEKISAPYIEEQLQAQANQYGKTIHLAYFALDGIAKVLEPR